MGFLSGIFKNYGLSAYVFEIRWRKFMKYRIENNNIVPNCYSLYTETESVRAKVPFKCFSLIGENQ